MKKTNIKMERNASNAMYRVNIVMAQKKPIALIASLGTNLTNLIGARDWFVLKTNIGQKLSACLAPKLVNLVLEENKIALCVMMDTSYDLNKINPIVAKK